MQDFSREGRDSVVAADLITATKYLTQNSAADDKGISPCEAQK